MKKSAAIITALVLGLVGLGIIIAFGGDKANSPSPTNSTDSTQPAQTNQTTEQQTQATPADDTTAAVVVLTYSNDGFSPETLNVKSGQTIEVKNTSSRPVDFSSDPHPAHTNNDDLNAGIISPGKSKKFTLTNKGVWGYHNHLNSSEEGKVTVE